MHGIVDRSATHEIVDLGHQLAVVRFVDCCREPSPLQLQARHLGGGGVRAAGGAVRPPRLEVDIGEGNAAGRAKGREHLGGQRVGLLEEEFVARESIRGEQATEHLFARTPTDSVARIHIQTC